MGVLARDGVFAAVKHYFGDKLYLILLLIPLLAASLLTILGTVYFMAEKIRRFDREALIVFLLFSLFIWY